MLTGVSRCSEIVRHFRRDALLAPLTPSYARHGSIHLSRGTVSSGPRASPEMLIRITGNVVVNAGKHGGGGLLDDPELVIG